MIRHNEFEKKLLGVLSGLFICCLSAFALAQEKVGVVITQEQPNFNPAKITC
jgi:hypothetical protein